MAYEPFTNAPGTAIIGSGGGFGFAGAWQDYQTSLGTATNTGFGLAYSDSSGNALATSGGAGFFKGLTTANSSMQPIRILNFSRGTNGIDGGTTWISFLVVRQGPTVSGPNPYSRGANMGHDINAGNLQKIAAGNSSGAAANSVGILAQGSGATLKSSTATFSQTNFIVVRIDHIAGAANDNAYLFVNPSLATEPATSMADTNSLGAFDYSFDRIRPFAGGNANAAQPYATLLLDEYRMGETYADVTPHTGGTSTSTFGKLIITNAVVTSDSVILSGGGGSNGAPCLLQASTDLTQPYTNWTVIASNTFDTQGNFMITDIAAIEPGKFFQVRQGTNSIRTPVPPSITSQPADVTIGTGQNTSFAVTASGDAPLTYRWYYNTNTLLAGATNASLSISNVQLPSAGKYSVTITNAGGATNSVFATLTVTNPPGFPIITAPPVSQSVAEGSNATFTVSANGASPLLYQWFYNTNTTLINATNTFLTISNTTINDSGGYSVRVTNSVGMVLSFAATLTVNLPLVAGAYFVSPSGNDANVGTEASPYKTIAKGLSKVTSGGVVYVRAGTYALSSKVSLSGTSASPGNMIRLWAYPGEFPVIDSTGNTSDGIGISGRYYHLKGLTVTLAGHNGINISGNSNIVEFCTTHDNSNTGLHLTGSAAPGPTGNLILNCDSYRNYDAPTHGQNADGFSAKWDIGPGNVFRGCRAWDNADDGWDLWMGTSPILIEACWAFHMGFNIWGDTNWQGNGNGFKLGGNYVGTPHRLLRSVAFGNAANGVDQNNNEEGQSIDQNTAWANIGRNYNLNHGTNSTPHIVRNNISIGGGGSDSFRSGTTFSNNSWQVISSPAANNSDFLGVDSSIAAAPRNADGSLPYWPFLRPLPNGRLVDKGVNIAEPYNGNAPDLGAFESP